VFRINILMTSFAPLMIQRTWLLALGWFAVTLLTQSLFGQGTQADYERASRLADLTSGKVFHASVEPHWLSDNRRFWYRVDLPDNQTQFLLVDAETGEKNPVFDHVRLAEALANAAEQPCDAQRLPFDWIKIDEPSNAVLFRAHDKGWSCSLESYTISTADVETPPERRGRRGPHDRFESPHPDPNSPDGKWTVAIKEFQLWLHDRETDEETVLGTDGSQEHFYEDQVYWSPDSTRFVAMKTRRGGDRKVFLIESSPKDQLQPKLDSYDYLKPGDDIPLTTPCLFRVADHQKIEISNALFPNPWSVSEVRWERDSKRFSFLYNQRGHQILRNIAVDGETGEARAIIDEQSPTFIDYAGKQFSYTTRDTDEIIWMSERDGWNHLYLVDSRTGNVKNPITQGNWVVRGVDHVDEARRQIWFRAGGIYPEHDPYYIHYCRINFDGSGLTRLTDGDGTHSVRFSPDRRFLVDTYSRVDMAPIVELRRAENGALIRELERGDMSALLATGWQLPERFVAKGRDSTTDIFGVIWRPTTFDPNKKYPVIEDIYAGPQDSFVPKEFSHYFPTQALAELGFILVQIDGMGTSNRSKAFHDVCWKNLGDAGLPDRVAWIKAAAAQYPCMDISRVGIYGGSAGGQSALGAMLAHGDFYRVCVADSGCHDNRMDKIWWNELWMGWPVGPHYEEQSNVTNAHKLSGKLLLIAGELDRNVDPASTMQVVNALIKADKDFELLIVPGGGHGIAESPYGARRRSDFFVRHLLGVEPRQAP
jgi:dipeptidyl aminopeptidase/acylaminoacyl peptidase